MTTILVPPMHASTPPMPAPDQRLILRSIRWNEYLAIGQILADRAGLRMTYDRGALEFMTLSPQHERYKHWLGRFLETLAEELSLPLAPGGSMTFKKQDAERGLEPDQCYWIAHEAEVRTKLTWDDATDPPPDLVIEIEISRSLLNRMGILASLGVPEIWCCDGVELTVYQLHADGVYRIHESSSAFPTVPVQQLVQFFPPAGNTDYLGAVRAVRGWVKSFLPQ